MVVYQQHHTSGATGSNIKFPLKTKDFVPFPHARDHLYGRQAQLQILTNTIQKVKVKSQVVFISGMAGAGKVLYALLGRRLRHAFCTLGVTQNKSNLINRPLLSMLSTKHYVSTGFMQVANLTSFTTVADLLASLLIV